MQISRSADADWPTNKPTSSSRCSGCCPTRPAYSCCGRSPTGSCRSTNSPTGRQAGAVGVATPGQAADGAAGAHPAGGHSGVLPAGERTRPPARHRRGVQRRARRRWRARAPPRRRGAAGCCMRRRRADGLSTSFVARPRSSQPRPRSQRRRRPARQRRRHPGRQDQLGRAGPHGCGAARDRRGVGLGRIVRRHRAQLLRRVDRGAAVDRFRDEPAGGHPSVHVRLWAS